MLLTKKDINLEWNIYPNIPTTLENNFDMLSNVNFDVKIIDKDNNLIVTKESIPSAKIDKIESYNLTFSPVNALINNQPISMEMLALSPKRAVETNFFNINVKKVVKQSFCYFFEENAANYYEKYNKHGFFNELNFWIKYNSSEHQEKMNVKYKTIDLKTIDFNSIFVKIFKSEDNISLKFKIDYSKYITSDIKSLLIIPYIYDNENKTKLKEIYISNIDQRWLNNSDSSKILTVPFEENTSVVQDILSLDIILLNNVQTEILDFYKERISRESLLNLIDEYFGNQKHQTGFVYGENLLNKIAAFYQGYIYLFNKESLENIAWPVEDQEILNLKYRKYFPLLSKNNIETISLENEFEVESSVLEVADYNMPEPLGYKIQNSNIEKTVESDLIYFKSNNIKSISILDIEEGETKNKIYLEYITNFDLLNDVYIDSLSNGLSYVQKYYKNINNINYVALLFVYEYDNNLTKNYQGAKSNIIQGKKLINFNIRLY